MRTSAAALALLWGCSTDGAGPAPTATGASTAPANAGAVAASGAGASAAPPVPPASASAHAPGPCPADMRLVAGGPLSTLERGADVDVNAFCLDAHEVTVASFRARVAPVGLKRRCDPPDACPSVPTRTDWGNPDEDLHASKRCTGHPGGDEQRPITCVSIEEAAEHCAAQGKRLPTGDEWEWAARGAARRRTPWGAPVATGPEACWGKPQKRTGPCPIGSMPTDVTLEGVFDLGGNASEWVTPPRRARESKGRWAYGASWYAVDDGYFGAALGGYETPARRAEILGFRCAETPG